MKITSFLLVTFLATIFKISAQTAGDYRSIASGNWNDATKWENYNGSNWVSATSYPGQNAGTGAVTVAAAHEIVLTAGVPYPIASLVIDQLEYYDAVGNKAYQFGAVTFSSAGPVSLIVTGDVTVLGSMSVADQNGVKNHSLTVGGSLVAGTWAYDEEQEGCDYGCLFYYCYSPSGGSIQTISNDDRLDVIFNTTRPNSSIGGTRTIPFQDISFNGIGLSVETSVTIQGTARFINGIVKSPGVFSRFGDTSYCGYFWTPDTATPPPSGSGAIFFYDGAAVLGASVNSFVNGAVTKQGNDSFTFPIGYEAEGVPVPLAIFAPLTISAPVGTQDVFSAYYQRASRDPVISDPGLFSISNCEYWDLSPGYQSNNVTSHLDVTAGWGSSSGCGSPYIANVPEVTLAHYNGTSWASHGGTGTGTTTNGSVTWTGVSAFGAFTFGNVATNCVPPSALSVANITSNSATLSWSAVPSAVNYVVGYSPAASCCWTTTSTSFNLSGLTPLVTYDWQVRANCGSSSSSARLGPQFTTPAPCGTPSGLSATNITTNSATLNWGAVSNAISYHVDYKQSTSANWITAATGVASPSYILSGLAAVTSYDWRVSANCSAGSGVYAQASFATITCNDIYEPNNGYSQAKPINLGSTILASISGADIDWFKVTIPNNSNTNLQVSLNNLAADYDLYVYNKNLALVGSSVNTGTSNELVSFSSHGRNATYYIEVFGKNGASNAAQCYSLLAQTAGSGGLVNSASSDLTDEITNVPNSPTLYPNPASEFIYLQFNSTREEAGEVEILNSLGQIVKRHTINVVTGYNQVKIPINDIRTGIYLLRTSRGELNMNRKFVIAR